MITKVTFTTSRLLRNTSTLISNSTEEMPLSSSTGGAASSSSSPARRLRDSRETDSTSESSREDLTASVNSSKSKNSRSRFKVEQVCEEERRQSDSSSHGRRSSRMMGADGRVPPARVRPTAIPAERLAGTRWKAFHTSTITEIFSQPVEICDRDRPWWNCTNKSSRYVGTTNRYF